MAAANGSPKGEPEQVRVHDFVDPELGKAIPYGVYDMTQQRRAGSASASITTRRSSPSATHPALVERRWARRAYPQAPATADHRRRRAAATATGCRLWKVELQELADDTGLRDRGLPLPAGHQQVEQDRASAVLATSPRTGAANPLVSHEVIVNLIANTTTTTGLKVRAELDPGTNTPPASKSVTRNLRGQPDPRRLPWRVELHHPSNTEENVITLFWRGHLAAGRGLPAPPPRSRKLRWRRGLLRSWRRV